MTDRDIQDAVRNNDYARVRELLERNSSLVNERNASGDTPLHVIFRNNRGYELSEDRLRMVKLLLEHGADINGQGHFGSTVLHLAILDRGIHTVEFLLESGADANVPNNLKQTPLHYALIYQEENLESVVRLLLRYKADFNHIDMECKLPLIRAIEKDRLDIVQMLVEAGAHVNDYTYKHTPLGIACKKLSIKIIDFLLRKGAKVNICDKATKSTPLHVMIEHYVSYTGDLESAKEIYKNIKQVIEILLEHGADINAMNCQRPAVEYALADFDLDLITILFDAGATYDLNKVMDYIGNTFLHMLLDSTSSNIETIARLFIKHGANIKQLNYISQTPFHLAVDIENINIINCMLANITGVDECTIKCESNLLVDLTKYKRRREYFDELEVAAFLGYSNIVDRLIELGHDMVTKKLDYRTIPIAPLDCAVENGHFLIAKMLLEDGYPINRYNDDLNELKLATLILQDMRISCLLLEYNAHLDDEKNDIKVVLATTIKVCKETSNSSLLIDSFRKLAYVIFYYYAIDIRSNRLDSSSILKFLESHEDLAEIFSSCNRQLDILKKEKIHKDISIYDILVRKVDSVAQLLGDYSNSVIVELILNYTNEEMHEINAYKAILNVRVALATEKRYLLDFAMETVDEIFTSYNLPTEIKWKILSYMTIRELRKMTTETE